MSDLSIENCVNKIPNRFELVLLATARAKSLSLGVEPNLTREGDKNTVLALREIEKDTLDLKTLRENIINKMQRYTVSKESEEDSEEIKAVEAEIMGNIYSDTEFSESDSFQVVEEL